MGLFGKTPEKPPKELGEYNFLPIGDTGIIQVILCLSFTAVLRVAGSLQKSTEVMKAMQSLVKIPEIQATMRELSKEMMKVRSVTYIRRALGKAPSKVTDALPEPEAMGAAAAVDEEEDIEAMQSRLATLRS
ncbi:hypothetical protein CIB84_013991 [Bambusicola thoracicus]|uniref:Uncharacterized protein n=1 Tax=Bambusicola thoracicus TaxID=9083 RepID=A0A2P4SDT1_BAMTH|nr:hypothetical protein CIB84_013991 [Bambusicola thoracicus]